MVAGISVGDGSRAAGSSAGPSIAKGSNCEICSFNRAITLAVPWPVRACGALSRLGWDSLLVDISAILGMWQRDRQQHNSHTGVSRFLHGEIQFCNPESARKESGSSNHLRARPMSLYTTV